MKSMQFRRDLQAYSSGSRQANRAPNASTQALANELSSTGGGTGKLPNPCAILSTGVLFAGGSEVAIMHGAEQYRLRLTRQNRLILTK